MRVNDQELSILAIPLYECLNELSAVGSSETEISCLMSQLQLIGQQLEVRLLKTLIFNWITFVQKYSMPKMNNLFVSIRNCFLDKSTSPLSRRILLEMIEGTTEIKISVLFECYL